MLCGPFPHQVGQLATVADRVGVVAEVAHHLDQPLLGRSAGQGARGGPAQQALPGQAEDGICGLVPAEELDDPQVMRRTVQQAKGMGVRVGAHPSYPDLLGFGRRAMQITRQEARDYLLYQIGALRAFCEALGVPPAGFGET